MSEYIIPSIYKKIDSDNYLTNSYNHLTRSKVIYFFFILIEIIINISQELETFLGGFNSEKNKGSLNYISYLTNQFDRIPIIGKIIVLLFFISIFDIIYYYLQKKKIKVKYNRVSILINILELFYFRVSTLILFNLFFTLPNFYFLVSLLFFIPNIYLIMNHFLYNHLYYFVPIFIDYPFDEFSSLYDIILLSIKLFLSVSRNTNNTGLAKFCFIIIFFEQLLFCFYFIYKLKNHSYLFMKNTFLNKTRISLFFTETLIIIFAFLFGKNEIINILFFILFIGILFIMMVYMYAIYNPYYNVKIKRETPLENVFFYLFIVSNKNDLDFLFENKVNEHYIKCGICSLCKKYLKYISQNHNLPNDEQNRLINDENIQDKNNINSSANLMDLFDIIYDGNNNYFQLMENIILQYKYRGKDAFKNSSYYYINLSFLIYSDYIKGDITLALNEKIILEAMNKDNKLLENHKSKISQILFCDKFISLGHKILNYLKEILNSEQNINKAKKIIDLSLLLKEMQKEKYRKFLLSQKQENLSSSKNSIMACSILYEEIFNTTISSSELPLRDNLSQLEEIFLDHKNNKIISLSVDLSKNFCKIVRAGKDLSSYKNKNLFDLFPLIFKEYQINLFLKSIKENFNINDEQNIIINYDNSQRRRINIKDENLKFSDKNLKTFLRPNNNNNKKIEYIEIKVIICEYISSKIFYKYLALKLTPLFNIDYNNYFILFDGTFTFYKNTIITLMDFEENKNPNERIISVSGPELDNSPEIYTMSFQKFSNFQNKIGYILSKITKFNLSTKYYSIYKIISKPKGKMRKNNKKILKAYDSNEEEEDKNSIEKSFEMEGMEENSSINSQQTDRISGLGNRNQKKDGGIYEYKNINKIKKLIYLSIPIILLVLIGEYIYLITLYNFIQKNNHSLSDYKEFNKLYFQLFTSILGIACVFKTDSKCNSLVSIYKDNFNFDNFGENFDLTLFIKVQSRILAKQIMERRNNLLNIHKNLGKEKYNIIFGENVRYLRLSQNFIKQKAIFNLTIINMQFFDAILVICNSFQILTNNTLDDPIYFLNKQKDPFSLLNTRNNDGKELSNYQKELYEMILNYKTYKEKFEGVYMKILEILKSKYKILRLNIYLFINLDTLLILVICSLLYAYIVYFEDILMRILNFVNVIINHKNDKFNFYSSFSQKIENLETIIILNNNEPIKSIRNINLIYNDYQKYLTIINKNNLNDNNKKYKAMPDETNKKSEMKSIPKNQRIVSKNDIRNFRITNYYLISFYFIFSLFLVSYIYLILLWINYFSIFSNLFILINKNELLESSLYSSINIYDLMIFNNYTIGELAEYIFQKSSFNENNFVIKSFYSDLKYAFNTQKEKNILNNYYISIEGHSNFSCQNLFEMNKENIEILKNNSESQNLGNITENLIKICEKSRLTESYDILAAFERHYQFIKNGILSINDFSEEGLINHIKTGTLGQVSIFFNCIILYVLDITVTLPIKLSLNNILNLLKKNIEITVILFIILDFILIFVVLFFYMPNIKNYCNQFFLLKKVFKICEVQE